MVITIIIMVFLRSGWENPYSQMEKVLNYDGKGYHNTFHKTSQTKDQYISKSSVLSQAKPLRINSKYMKLAKQITAQAKRAITLTYSSRNHKYNSRKQGTRSVSVSTHSQLRTNLKNPHPQKKKKKTLCPIFRKRSRSYT